MTPARSIECANRIKAFVEDEHVSAMFDALEKRYLDQIMASEPDQRGKREDAYRMLRALQDLHAEMRGAVNAGVFEQARSRNKS